MPKVYQSLSISELVFYSLRKNAQIRRLSKKVLFCDLIRAPVFRLALFLSFGRQFYTTNTEIFYNTA